MVDDLDGLITNFSYIQFGHLIPTLIQLTSCHQMAVFVSYQIDLCGHGDCGAFGKCINCCLYTHPDTHVHILSQLCSFKKF